MRTAFIAAALSALASVLVASSPALAQQKTVKACQEEWRANKAANQANKITEKAYVDQCRGAASATPTPTAAKPAPAPTAPSAAPPPTTPASAPAPAPASKSTRTATPSGPNEFSTEAEAKAKSKCTTDTVVWANLKSKVYHFAGYKNYGDTKTGAYMCEKDATAQGFRAAKNEKHPA
jgi:hypothetical protein